MLSITFLFGSAAEDIRFADQALVAMVSLCLACLIGRALVVWRRGR